MLSDSKTAMKLYVFDAIRVSRLRWNYMYFWCYEVQNIAMKLYVFDVIRVNRPQWNYMYSVISWSKDSNVIRFNKWYQSKKNSNEIICIRCYQENATWNYIKSMLSGSIDCNEIICVRCQYTAFCLNFDLSCTLLISKTLTLYNKSFASGA